MPTAHDAVPYCTYGVQYGWGQYGTQYRTDGSVRYEVRYKCRLPIFSWAAFLHLTADWPSSWKWYEPTSAQNSDFAYSVSLAISALRLRCAHAASLSWIAGTCLCLLVH